MVWAPGLFVQKVDDAVADFMEPLHHHQMPGSLYHDQPAVLHSFRDASAADTLRAGVHGGIGGELAVDDQGRGGDVGQVWP